jgi:hypothetical protein
MPTKQQIRQQAFFCGEVYQAHWIVDSVRIGELIDKD